MVAKRDISHLPLLEQQAIEAERARKRDVYHRAKAGLTVNLHVPKGLPEEDKRKLRQEARSYRSARWYAKNQEQRREVGRDYYRNNAEARRAYSKTYKAENAESVNATRRVSAAKKRADPFTRMIGVMRSRLSQAMARGSNRAGSAIRDLGCSYAELKVHLEALFTEGMSWETYGRYGWHLDHHIPLASFDLTDREQFLQAVHYTNLRPLWWRDNLTKGSKIPDPANDRL